MAIETIKNSSPDISTLVTLKTPFVAACPYSGEPQEGSFISVTYSPKDVLIELHGVEKYLKTLSEGKDALDLETVAQMLFTECRNVDSVKVKAVYKLRNGLEMTCECS